MPALSFVQISKDGISEEPEVIEMGSEDGDDDPGIDAFVLVHDDVAELRHLLQVRGKSGAEDPVLMEHLERIGIAGGGRIAGSGVSVRQG